MSLIDSINRPKWQHKDPEVRIEAIGELDDQDILLELLSTDPDSAVQSSALSRISSPDTLDGLIDTLLPPLQQQARSQRLQQLLPDPDKLAAIEDDAVLLRIASLTDDTELLEATIAQIKSKEVLLDVASQHPLAKVRLTAAHGIKDFDVLDELLHRARGHDKAVYRHCKTLLDAHHAEQHAEAERQEKIRQLTEKARELASAVESPEYWGRCQALALQWQPASEWASDAQKAQIEPDLAICAERLARHTAAQTADEQRVAELENARQALPALIAELEQIDADTALPEETPAVRQLTGVLDDLEKRWLASTEIAPASKEQLKAFREYLDRWRCKAKTAQNLISKKPALDKILREAKSVDASDYLVLQRQIERTEKLLGSLPWPDSNKAALPPRIEQLRQTLKQLDAQRASLNDGQEKYVEKMAAAVEKLRLELEQEHSKDADRWQNKARRALKPLAPKQRQHFEQELRPLAARLHEVHDWQGFAIEPKKVELCARMSALIGSEDNTDILAAQIKSLQDEWKQIGALPHAREQALWLEFKAAADEAWKPCKAAFALQAEQRRENFKQRMQLVAQLADYEAKMAWPSAAEPAIRSENGEPESGESEDGRSEEGEHGAAPDWRLVQKTLDTARAAFRNIKPVTPKGDRKSQKAFRAVCDRIYSHIKEEYGRNIARKEELVERAQELVVLEDLGQAIDSCKRIQRDWKEIGMTPVGADRKLWKKFRGACDAVFARLDEQRNQSKAETDALVKQAESLRDQARALIDSGDDEQRLHLKRDLLGLKQQFRSIDLPRSVQQRLGRDFQNFEKQAQDLAHQFRVQREQAAWQQLLDKITACALKHSDEKAADKLWQEGSNLPKGIEIEPLETFWQQGPADENDEAFIEACREACIALEILGEIESPTEDKEARMKYQMKRLVEGMGSRQLQAGEALLAGINSFIALRPSNDWTARFCSAVEKTRAGLA